MGRRGQPLLISNIENAKKSRLFAGIFFKILQVGLHIAPPGKKSPVRLWGESCKGRKGQEFKHCCNQVDAAGFLCGAVDHGRHNHV